MEDKLFKEVYSNDDIEGLVLKILKGMGDGKQTYSE